MELNKGDNTVASIPTPDAGGTAGYFKNQGSGPPWTVIKADFLNGIADELKNVIEDIGGLTLDGADNTQLYQSLARILGILSSGSAMSGVTTERSRVAVASDDATVTAVRSAAVASDGCRVAATDANSSEGAAIASFECDTDGFQVAVIASTSDSVTRCDAQGTASAIIASASGCVTGDAGAQQLIAASIASATTNSRTAVVASLNSAATGVGTLCIGGNNVEVNTLGMIGGGDNSGASAITPSGSDQGLTWSISKEGEISCQALDVDNGVALGGGAAPTLGTIGGSGPATAGQSKWLEIKIGGTSHWIPVWV